jgi:hypothetical protein
VGIELEPGVRKVWIEKQSDNALFTIALINAGVLYTFCVVCIFALLLDKYKFFQ